jgi:hypothetical protein
MPVQGGFQRDAHRCLWQGCRVRFWLRWLAWCLSLAVGVSIKLRRGQLLRPPGNRSAQTVLTKVVRPLLIYSGWRIDRTGQDDAGLLSGCCHNGPSGTHKSREAFELLGIIHLPIRYIFS